MALLPVPVPRLFRFNTHREQRFYLTKKHIVNPSILIEKPGTGTHTGTGTD